MRLWAREKDRHPQQQKRRLRPEIRQKPRLLSGTQQQCFCRQQNAWSLNRLSQKVPGLSKIYRGRYRALALPHRSEHIRAPLERDLVHPTFLSAPHRLTASAMV
eukprot:3933583-Rhodomonas_salina.2